MNRGSKRTDPSGRDPDPLDDAVASVVRYARQETVVPLRGAGRWLAFGLVGAVFVGSATVTFVLACLRLVQDLGGTALDGGWSFVPYVAAFVITALLTALALAKVGGSELNKHAHEGGPSHG